MTGLWTLRPGKGIGPVDIGIKWPIKGSGLAFERISSTTEYGTLDEDYEDATGNIVVSTEDGIVRVVEANRICMFHGRNLIGMRVDDLERTLGCTASSVDGPILYENGDTQTFRNYDKLDMFATIEDGIAIHIACFGSDDE